MGRFCRRSAACSHEDLFLFRSPAQWLCFRGRHADSDYHHEQADTADKLNVRETKEYAGQLARLLLRLSHAAPETWPENEVSGEAVQARLGRERETVVRVY